MKPSQYLSILATVWISPHIDIWSANVFAIICILSVFYFAFRGGE